MAAVATQEAVPSFMRTVPGSVNIPIARFPSSTVSPPSGETELATVASEWATKFNQLLEAKDYAGLSHLFVDDGYWRDHLALTWRYRTIHTPAKIEEFLKSCAADAHGGFKLTNIAIDATNSVRKPQVKAIPGPNESISTLRSFIKFESTIGSGDGVVNLVKDKDGSWKIFFLYTRLDELAEHEEATYERRPQGVQHGGRPDRKNWSEQRHAESEFDDGNEPTVVIIGAGQAGLTAAARLKMLGVDALIIDKNERVGDNWRKRYHQLVLHDPVWYDHLPYMPFPPQWPIFTPKDKLAQFFESYANLLELNVWTRTEMTSTKWDASARKWTIEVSRKLPNGGGDRRTLHPRHVIQATGHSGKKNQPAIEGFDSFKGDTLCHSSEFVGARKNSQGKKAVVVGSCNSAHDIAQDFLEKGYDVTIVQRSTTNVVSSKANCYLALEGAYEEGGPDVEEGDLISHSAPLSVTKAKHVDLARRQAEHDKDILDGLAKAGFKVDRGPDDAGLFIKYFQRGGGYYIDVGASKLIAEGKIKVKQGQEIEKILPNGLRFKDGTELEADEIVLATGYQNMRTETRVMFGDEIADQVVDVWGLDEEGEMKGMWQRSGHPGFWFHGGNLALCRYFSKLLALQIKALEEGIAPVKLDA